MSDALTGKTPLYKQLLSLLNQWLAEYIFFLTQPALSPAQDSGATIIQHGANLGNYIIAPVPIPFIDYLWHEIEPILALAVERGNDEISCYSVKQRALNGDCLINAILHDGCIIAIATTEFRTFDTGHQALYIPIMAGKDLELWGHQFFDFCVNMATEYGVDDIRATGRKGWLKKLNMAGLGFNEISTTISYKIGG